MVNVLLLILLSTQTDSGETGYIFLQHIDCILALGELDKTLGLVCPWWSITAEKGYSASAE